MISIALDAKLKSENKKALKPIYPNRGIEAAYRRKLLKLVEEMQKSISWWISARYREHEHLIAQDDMVQELQDEMLELKEKWIQRFEQGAQNLAKWFADKNKDYASATMRSILKDAGISFNYKMTESSRIAYEAVIAENVGLIKSIAQQHLSQVETMVMSSVSAGRDLATLTKELKARYAITNKRARLIALDQNNKATSIITKNLQNDLGITEAIWRHSTAGKHPRPEHVAADGEVYKVDKGLYLEGEWTHPGMQINCRCISVPIIEGWNN